MWIACCESASLGGGRRIQSGDKRFGVAAGILVKNPETWPDTAFRVGSSHRNRQRDMINVPLIANLQQDPWERYQSEGG